MLSMHTKLLLLYKSFTWLPRPAYLADTFDIPPIQTLPATCLVAVDEIDVSVKAQTGRARETAYLFLCQKLMLVNCPSRAYDLAYKTANPLFLLFRSIREILNWDLGRLPPTAWYVELQKFSNVDVGTHDDSLDNDFFIAGRRFDESVEGSSRVVNVKGL